MKNFKKNIMEKSSNKDGDDKKTMPNTTEGRLEVWCTKKIQCQQPQLCHASIVIIIIINIVNVTTTSNTKFIFLSTLTKPIRSWTDRH
jgi:hypothetical protein